MTRVATILTRIGFSPGRGGPWGSAEVRIGNNPVAIGIPRADGPLVLDMAISQISSGKLEIYGRAGEPLPVAGGYDGEGGLSTDAAAIRASGRQLCRSATGRAPG